MSDAHDRQIPSDATTDSSTENPRLDARLLHTYALYVVDHAGQAVFDEMIQKVGIEPAAFQKKSYWLSLAQVEALLQACYELVGSDEEEFKRASAYRVAEALGPFRFINRAFSPQTIITSALKNTHMVATFARGEVISSSPRHVLARYHSQVSESRLMCLHRQALAASQLTLWGLPPATINETKCICWGDPCCEHRLEWHVPRRPWISLLGAGLGALGAWAASALGWADPLFAGIVLPAGGLFAGFAGESVRANRLNLRTAEEQAAVVRHYIQQDAEARLELLSIQDRQSAWHKKIQEQKDDNAAQLEAVLHELQDSQAIHKDTARGLTHDLRTPLGIIQMTSRYLAQRHQSDKSSLEAIEEIRITTDRMDGLIGDFIRLTQHQSALPELNPQHLRIEDLQQSLHRRLVALTLGCDVLPLVDVDPSAPDSFRCDPQLFDRILDNLLTNAAKNTVQGSIRVRFEGSDDHCAVVVADTGCGIAPERIKQAFLPGGTAQQHRTPDSYGLGLSVTLQLLGQIGGHLEIASAPGKGTTIRVHFPLDIQPATDTAQQDAKRTRDPEQLFSEIVHIES